MRTPKSIGLLAVLLAAGLPVLANETITNLMSSVVSYHYPENLTAESLSLGGVISPVASYQYPENFNTAALTSGGVLSPVASYQYYEWAAGTGLGLASSLEASYYYPVLPVDVPSMLQLQAASGRVVLAWPVSTGSFSVQTTTNVGDPNSWVTLTNVPTTVNVQTLVTNAMTGNLGFFRLIPAN